MWFMVSGVSFMLAAVLSDPWGRSWACACLYLLGAALFVLGLAGAW